VAWELLIKESNKIETDSHISDVDIEDRSEQNKLTDEEEIHRNQTPEGIDDSSLAGQIIPSLSQKKEENTTPREPNWDSDNNDNEIPILSYSEDDKSSEDSYTNKRLLKEVKKDEEFKELPEDHHDFQVNQDNQVNSFELQNQCESQKEQANEIKYVWLKSFPFRIYVSALKFYL